MAAADTSAAPVSLLDQGANFVGGIGNALMSLLAPVVSEGAVKSADDPGAVPAFLAFANRMAQAGAPTLGPPRTLMSEIPQAMTAGYSAARQADLLPMLSTQAGLETQREQLGLATQAWQLERDKALWALTVNPAMISQYTGQPVAGATPGSAATPAGPGGPGTVAAPSTVGLPANAQTIAALPDVQRLPDATRPLAIAAMAKVGMGPDEAAQYARMLMQESAGQQIDPKTGQIMTSSKGAQGIAQVMPGTFSDMKKKYAIDGDITDPTANLLAGANYFHEGAAQDGLFNATVRYSAGPGGLQKYLQGGPLPAETADYLAKTRAPGGPVQVAGPGAPTLPTPGAAATGTGTNAEDMVVDPVTKQMVPAGILASARQAAQAAIMGGKPMEMAGAYNATIAKWQQDRAVQGTVIPIAPGIGQKSTTGELVEQPLGATVASELTPDEYQKFAPNRIPGMDYVGQRYISGPLAGQLKGPPEVLAPRSAGLPFQQANDIQQTLVRQPAMQNQQQAQARYDMLMASLNQRTRAGDQGAVAALAKIFDPTAVVHENHVEMAQQYGGLQQRFNEWLGSMTGEAGMPDDVRQQIGNLASSEMQTRDQAALQQVQQSRDFAVANGVDAHRIMPSFRTSALGADAAGPYANMPGVTYQPAYTWDASQGKFTRTEAQPVAPAQPARRPQAAALPAGAPAAPAPSTPAAPPAPPGGATAAPGGAATVAAPTPSTPPTASPGGDTGAAKLTPLGLNQMSAQGLARLGADMKAHPDRYTDADRDLYIGHIQGRSR